VAGHAIVDGEPRPMSGPELALGAIRLAFTNYRVLIKAIAVILVPTFVIGGVLSGYSRSLGTTGAKPSGSSELVELLAIAVFLLGNFFAQAVGARAVADLAAGRPADWRGSVRAASARASAVVAASLSVAVLVALGTLLFAIPGVYLLISLFVVLPVVVLEGRTSREALARSSFLVRGRWWGVLGGYLLVQLFIAVWSFLAGYLVGVLVNGSPVSHAVVAEITPTFAEFALAPISIAFVTVVYLDLLFRKQGISPPSVDRGPGFGSDRAAGEAPGAPWADASPTGGAAPWPQAWGPSAQSVDGPWWPKETPGPASPPGEQPTRPPGWPAVSPKPPEPDYTERSPGDSSARPSPGIPTQDTAGEREGSP
jgi:hypothetical protein